MFERDTVVSAALCLSLFLFASCARTVQPVGRAGWDKIEFDLGQLDDDGLCGPAEGKVSLAYEFAIPNTGAARAQVAAIDPTVQFMPSSAGRIGARKDQCLCIGETHQADYRKTLQALATLPFIDRIIQCHFE
ncbi:MAG: hypothetical protein ISS31_09035 [Kiritimatiellae bacterium]|nr:hypothetical protein [Kiritimatiellia bacterium]